MKRGCDNVPRVTSAEKACLGNDQMLCHIILFGVTLGDMVGDALGKKQWKVIEQANKKDKWPPFYGLGTNGNSYQYDTYETHVESVTVDVGVEIGPNLHHPHFHALLTVNHYSYVQIDDRALRSMLEKLFKGLPQPCDARPRGVRRSTMDPLAANAG